MNRQKIYIVSWNGMSDFGGVERVTYYMVQAWKDLYDVELIDFATMRRKVPYRLLLGKHYIIDAILVSIYTNNLLQRNKDNIVKIVTQGFNAPYVNADLYFSHGTMRGYKLAITKDTKWHFNQWFEKISAKRAARIVAVSSFVKEEQINLYGTDLSKIIVIENCVDTDVFKPIDLKRHDNIVRILYAGRLEFGKGIDELIELAECIERRSDLRLSIAANSSENIEYFSKFKNIEINVGLNRDSMNDFYNSGDIMFFPSIYEGFGLVTLEALSAGIPVIGNSVGAIAELIKRGQKGVEILQKDMDKNIDIIIKLVGTYRHHQTRLQLHKDMVEHYSFDVYLDKLRSLWE